jgi:uridine kinase
MSEAQCYVVGIAGGSCSGKTTLAQALFTALGGGHCGLIYQDSYYIDQSARFKEDGGEVNFDHPSAIDFALLARHLSELRRGHGIDVPVYDFVTHTRKATTVAQDSRAVILVDGTLILSQPEVREFLDESIFVECSEAMRFDRRKQRDTRERGREVAGVVRQFNNHVKPMHDQFVEPSKRHASKLLANDEFPKFVRDFLAKLRAKLI